MKPAISTYPLYFKGSLVKIQIMDGVDEVKSNSHEMFYWVLVILVIALGVWFGVPYLQKPAESKVIVLKERPKIDPQTFTRAGAIDALNFLETTAQYDFNKSLPRTVVPSNQFPAEASKFVYLYPGTEMEVEYSEDGEFYYAAYKAEGAMPDNFTRLLRTADPKEYKMINGKKNELASLLEIESAHYEISISQLAESEEMTEIMMYARKK